MIFKKFRNKERVQEITELKNQQLEDRTQIQDLQLWILYLIIGGLVLLALVGVYYLKRIQKQRLEQEQTEKHLAELKLMALQSQMNPHFIFNCINTAQSFVINSQKAEAYEYLANFAKLLRLVLTNSKHANIALEEFDRSYYYWFSNFISEIELDQLVYWKWAITLVFSVIIIIFTLSAQYLWFKSMENIKLMIKFYLLLLFIACLLSLSILFIDDYSNIYSLLRKIIGLIQSPLPCFLFFAFFYWDVKNKKTHNNHLTN